MVICDRCKKPAAETERLVRHTLSFYDSSERFSRPTGPGPDESREMDLCGPCRDQVRAAIDRAVADALNPPRAARPSLL